MYAMPMLYGEYKIACTWFFVLNLMVLVMMVPAGSYRAKHATQFVICIEIAQSHSYLLEKTGLRLSNAIQSI